MNKLKETLACLYAKSGVHEPENWGMAEFSAPLIEKALIETAVTILIHEIGAVYDKRENGSLIPRQREEAIINMFANELTSVIFQNENAV